MDEPVARHHAGPPLGYGRLRISRRGWLCRLLRRLCLNLIMGSRKACGRKRLGGRARRIHRQQSALVRRKNGSGAVQADRQSCEHEC